MKPAHRKTKGFTLLEMLVVFAITIILVAITLAGLTYLQNAVRLDNSIRDIKVEIQSTQNNARNSLVVRPGQSLNNLSNNNISIGWMFTVQNSSTGISIQKRSVFFQPLGYDITTLREDIKTLFVNAADQNFSCNNNLLYRGSPTPSFQMRISGRDIYCAQSSEGANDFSQINISGVKVLESIAGQARCTVIGSGVNTAYNLFFTSGYGETVANSSAITACQIGITNASVLSNSRSIRIRKDTGSISVCGNYCP